MLRRLLAIAIVLAIHLVPLTLPSPQRGEGSQQDQEQYNPKISGPSNEALTVMKRFQLAKGTEATLIAAEPLLANPVAFCFDEKGSIYVAETFRLNAGVTDNRKHMKAKKSWLDDEIACHTVEDRVAMYFKHLGKAFEATNKNHDRVRKIIDTDGDGIPDKAYAFAEGFNTPASGVGAGVLARGGKVYFTCIPDLWLLEDSKGDHKADTRKSLHYGYGVHTAYIGHDMHGLIVGFDGRLYFSIGDRGFHVETNGKVVSNPHSGAVLRCNPDGSELEIVAYGMRNPQELAFDPYGNLFSGDNNADGGDKARWLHIVEGGDSGWRIGYQEINKPNKLGPWNSEKMWQPQHDGQPAHIVPPLANIGNGPSGLVYHPGVTQLPERYKDHFFMCDFRGTGGGSGIHAFQLKPKGATFEVSGKIEKFAWAILPTDCDFGPDGGFYWSDWIDGWEVTGKGRIYKIADPNKANDPAVLEVKMLLADGMSKRTPAELVKLLDHADMRVRKEAQFELAERKCVDELVAATKGSKLAKLHGVWGLGMVHRTKPMERMSLLKIQPLLEDNDIDVRCQAIKELGESKEPGLLVLLSFLEQLKSNEPRIRFFAAQALGTFVKNNKGFLPIHSDKISRETHLQIGNIDLVPPLGNLFRDNADKDPYLRHAGVMALVALADKDALIGLAKDPSASVRLGSLLAMRRLGMSEVTQFLKDADPRIVLEAARAINDQPIDTGMSQLAAMITRVGLPDQLMYRVINANYRLKTKESAAALAKFAGRSDVPEALRLEAVDCLLSWEEARVRDRVVGLYRPVAGKPAKEIVEVVRPHLGGIFGGSNKVRAEAGKLAAKLGIKEVGDMLADLAIDLKLPAGERIEAMKALAALNHERLEEAMTFALSDKDPLIRTEGRRMLAKHDPDAILDELKSALDEGKDIDRQGAFEILAGLKQAEATTLIETWLDKLLAKKVPPAVQLDLLEAAAKHKSDGISKKLAQHEANRSPKDHLAKWRETLQGGNAENGKRIFFERSDVSCLRCHVVQGVGGDVGPDLTSIAAKQTREYLLEALVDPDKQIAQGYETLVLTLNDGKVKSGILKSEDKKEVRLMTPEGAVLVVPVSDIDSRARGPSAMPGDLTRLLTLREIRDLVEYLGGRK